MEPIETPSTFETLPDTLSDELDRLEVPAGKIGMNTPEKAFFLLYGLDAVSERMRQLSIENPSRKVAEAQFEAIGARLHKEAGRFIRDLGGVQALRQARTEAKPPEDHWWWYLDRYLVDKRRAALRRSLVIGGLVVVALVALGLIYERFLAPDPKVTAVYGHTQNANEKLAAGDLNGALKEVDLGLQVNPKDAPLLIMKGVILESQGQSGQAAQSYDAAQAVLNNRADFLVTRGQAYIMVNKVDKALADAQAAVQADPQSPNAFMLLGQVYEVQRDYQKAMDAYNKAFDVANKTNQTEMAALARLRIGMLMQSMNSQISTEPAATPTP